MSPVGPSWSAAPGVVRHPTLPLHTGVAAARMGTRQSRRVGPGPFPFPPGPTALTISFLGVATSFRATRQSRWFSGMTGGFAVRSALREYTALVGPFPAGPTAPDDVKWTPHRQGDEAKPPVVNPPDGFAASPQMTTRRFPPPWSVADSTRKSGRGASKSVCLSAVGPRSTAPGEEVRHPTLPCAPRCIPHAARRGTRQSRRS